MLPILHRLAELAEAQSIYLVGGAVRDLLLGQAPHDIDLVLAGDAVRLARRLATATGGAFVPLHDRPPTARVVLPAGISIDLASYRGADLSSDLRARDFTINAMALPVAALLAGQPLDPLDPTGGRHDLTAGRLRLASPSALVDDPLRILRAYRLQATTGWRLTRATRAALRQHRHLLDRPARERIAAELAQMLLSPRLATSLRLMANDGVLSATLPSLLPAGRPLPTWRRLRRLLQLEQQLPDRLAPPLAGQLVDWLARPLTVERPHRLLLRWLALVLDAWATEPLPLDRPTALGRLPALAATLGAGRRETQLADRLIGALIDDEPGRWPPATPATRQRLAELNEAAPGALLLAQTARSRPTAEAIAHLGQQLDLYWTTLMPLLAAPPLLDGQHLMTAFNLSAGPRLGRLLAHLRLARLRGEIATPAEALQLAGRWLARPASA